MRDDDDAVLLLGGGCRRLLLNPSPSVEAQAPLRSRRRFVRERDLVDHTSLAVALLLSQFGQAEPPLRCGASCSTGVCPWLRLWLLHRLLLLLPHLGSAQLLESADQEHVERGARRAILAVFLCCPA